VIISPCAAFSQNVGETQKTSTLLPPALLVAEQFILTLDRRAEHGNYPCEVTQVGEMRERNEQMSN